MKLASLERHLRQRLHSLPGGRRTQHLVQP